MNWLARRLSLVVLGLVLIMLAAGPASSQMPRGHGAESYDMELVGHDDLQGRSAYQPTIHQQRGRFVAYVGHHGGKARNPLTGREEDNGTSIVDVTDPAKPAKTSTVVTGLSSTHKNWWECDTGIAYLISGDLAKANPMQVGSSGWRTQRMTKIYDLSDPAKPVSIRDFGLAGQEPGSTGPIPIPQGAHGPIVAGNRVYFAHGTSADGALQIVDRDKLLKGPRDPTAANLNYPEISRLYMSPNWGGHTAFPVLGMTISDWTANTTGHARDFLILVSEAIANECREFRHATFMVDITT